MSHLTIQRKRTQNIRSKLYSEQSKNIAPRHSTGKILNDSISKRRRTTHNSPDQSQSQTQEQINMSSQFESAKQLYKNKDTKNALVLLKKLYKKHPSNSQICYFIGSCYLNEANFDSALIHFKNCLLLNENFNKNIYICMAICYKAQGRFKQAINILNSACIKFPKFKQAYFYKGKMYMKLAQYDQAIISFKKCIKLQPNNQLCILFLADCLKNSGQYIEALQKYDHIINTSKDYLQRALIKKINLLLDYKKTKLAQKQIEKAQNLNIQSAQLNYLKGHCEYQFGNFSDAITFFELSLASNIPQSYICKALKFLIQISINEKDFFGAQHLISRSKFTNVNQDQLKIYYKLVQGINDLIKKRLNQCEEKLEFVYTHSLKQATDSQRFLYQQSAPYYAYCLFSIQKYEKALQIYKKSLRKKDQFKKIQHYNALICQGVVVHKKDQFSLAQIKFKEALKIIGKKIQPIFLLCVNIVQQVKNELTTPYIRSSIMEKLETHFKKVEQMKCATPLFLFYQSLVYLFEGKDSCQIIDKAISLSQEQVSQYFFIQALAYSMAGQNIKGLQSITKAIQLDHNIPQFYKERSKYFYVLQRYDQALSDIIKILQQTNDQQAKLLLTFYYYMTNDYSLSLQILLEVSQHCSQDKFRQFQMALYFRLHIYDKCGMIGILLKHIIQRKQLDVEFLQNFKDKCLTQRETYSQFTVHHFHLILSAYYFYNKQYDQCLQHLFGALQQIQINSQSDEYMTASNQKILNQIKFNIIITNLQKQSQKIQNNSCMDLKDSCRFIQMFLAETEDYQFIQCMNLILNIIKSTKLVKKDQLLIDLYVNSPKISDDLPMIEILTKSQQPIMTKFLLLYPQKLRFNINPEFDQSFLTNFDIDKVQSKLCPPWFKLHDGQLIFTDKIRNQSVLISETERVQTPSLIISPSPMPQNLKQKFKLDDIVQKRLQKIIKTQKKKQEEKLKNSKSKVKQV